MKKALLTLSLVCCIGITAYSQVPNYHQMSQQDSANFFSIRDITQHYFDSTGLDTVQGSGYKQFKRWEMFWKSIFLQSWAPFPIKQ